MTPYRSVHLPCFARHVLYEYLRRKWSWLISGYCHNIQLEGTLTLFHRLFNNMEGKRHILLWVL